MKRGWPADRRQAGPAALLTFLEDVGIAIGAGTIARWLSNHTGQWHDEAVDIHAAGLASGPWQGTDQTSTRVDGHNETCHVVGNVWFTSYHTRPGGTRQDVLAVRWGQELVFVWNADALAWMADTTLRPALQIRLVQALPWEHPMTAAELVADIRLNTQQRPQVWDALAITAYHAQTGIPIVRGLRSVTPTSTTGSRTRMPCVGCMMAATTPS